MTFELSLHEVSTAIKKYIVEKNPGLKLHEGDLSFENLECFLLEEKKLVVTTDTHEPDKTN